MISMVIEGEYKGRPVSINMKGEAYIDAKHRQKIMITPEFVRSFEVIEVDGKKSFVSSAVRGAVGGALLGDVGAVAGINSAKSINNAKIKIVFKDGKASLVHVEKCIYEAVVNKCFNLEPTNNTSNNKTGNFCINCGATLIDSAKFCGSCGARVLSIEQPVSQQEKKDILTKSEEQYRKAVEKHQQAEEKLKEAKEKSIKQTKEARENLKKKPNKILLVILAILIGFLIMMIGVINSDVDDGSNDDSITTTTISQETDN